MLPDQLILRIPGPTPIPPTVTAVIPADVLQIIEAIEIGLMKIGKSIELGKGTEAAQQIYLQQGVHV